MRHSLWFRLTALATCLLVVTSCMTTQLPPLSVSGGPGQLLPDEEELWDEARLEESKLQENARLWGDREVEAYLEEVAGRLSPRTSVSYRVHVVDDPALNAFAYPHGALYVHTGLLARLDNESQLATVLGHEMTHVENRHMLRHRRSAQNKEIGLLVAGVAAEIILAEAVGDAFEAGDWGKGAAIDVFGHLIVGLGLQLAFVASVNGYGRKLETEADEGGFARIEAAGYDVGQAEKVYLALANDHGDPTRAAAFFFSSHPRLAERVANARAYAAARAPREAPFDEPRFRRLLLPIVQSDAHSNIDQGRLKTAASGVDKALAWKKNDPENPYLLGRLRLAEAAAAGDQAASEALKAEAEAALREAIRLDADRPGPHRELGLLLYQEGRLKNACTELRQYVELTRDDADETAVETLEELKAGRHCR